MADVLRTTLATIAAAVVRPYPDIAPLIKALTNTAQIQLGSTTGTGVSLPVTIVGTPRACFAFNRTDPTFVFKTDGMTGEYAMKLIDTGPALTYDNSILAFSANAMTFGTDGDVNVIAQNIEWVVWI
jgi:hypothetical protein